MATDSSFRDFVLDQLESLPELTCRRMFGGYGLREGQTFFAVIADGRLYLWTDDETRSDFTARAMEPFRPAPGKTLSAYWEVPLDVLEDSTRLTAWVRRALEARRAKDAEQEARPSRERAARGRRNES